MRQGLPTEKIIVSMIIPFTPPALISLCGNAIFPLFFQSMRLLTLFIFASCKYVVYWLS